ncbi:MAG: HAD family hydrolase [Lentisphaerae bacterium]|nr:HAD family hydrolase [Lentisphaerota bacterium]
MQTHMPFDAVIFDLDGTLTRPVLDFRAIRRELDLPEGDLAELIARLAPAERRRAWAVIEAHEARALENRELQEGCLDLLRACRRHGLKVGLVTRNSRRSADDFCRAYAVRFDGVVTREFPRLKPHPAPVRHLIEQWRLDPGRVLMVGDYRHDIESGRAAGTQTCFFQNPGLPSYGRRADFVVSSMRELGRLLLDPV